MKPESPEARTARRILAHLDLTCLDEDARPAAIVALCRRAGRWPPAALCVYPEYILTVREHLPGVPVATVVNFPDGGEDADRVAREIHRALAAGAAEIDLVLPWRALVDSRPDAAQSVVGAARASCPAPAVLKLILETGELETPERIRAACRIGLECGVDFLKTSTGKTGTGATPGAARVMLEEIAAAGGICGLKVSGGIRDLDAAEAYLDLAEDAMGADWVNPARFRIGASGLFDAIESALGAGSAS